MFHLAFWFSCCWWGGFTVAHGRTEKNALPVMLSKEHQVSDIS